METKRPCIRVCSRRHVSAPDHLGAGCRLLPLVRGPVTIQAVRDLIRGPGPYQGSGTSARVRDSHGGPGSTGGPEPRLFGLSARLSRDTRRSRIFPSRETGPGPLSREIGLRTTGVRLFGRS